MHAICDLEDSVIDFNDETFKNCSLKLAFRKIKNFKYNDVELANASLDFVGYHYEYNILYIYLFTFIIYMSFKVYCQLLQNDVQHLLVYRYSSQFHGQIACALFFIRWTSYAQLQCCVLFYRTGKFARTSLSHIFIHTNISLFKVVLSVRS